MSISSILHEVFKFPGFRSNQEKIINSILDKQDTLAVLPTGAGKSLCFSLSAVAEHRKHGTCAVVISPLISLMTEQTEKLQALGLGVARLCGTGDDAVLEKINNNQLCLVFCSPEKFIACEENFRQLHANKKLSFFAIDEVHCVADWGDNFRPDYRKLALIKNAFPDLPLLALTATLTPKLHEAVTRILLGSSRSFSVFTASMNRPNLFMEVRAKPAMHEFFAFVAKLSGSGIIYCHTQDECNRVAATMQAGGLSCVVYHAAVANRGEHQRLWTSGARQWAVATVALGMGVDKADTRHVIHLGMPLTLDRYMQEIGRAGRDGKPARCVLFWESKDETSLSFALRTDEAFDQIRQVREFCLLRAPDCRRQALLAHFGENFDKANCQETCDLCVPSSPRESAKVKEFDWFEKIVVECVRANPGLFTAAKIRDAALGIKPLPSCPALNSCLRAKDKQFVDKLIETMVAEAQLMEEGRKLAKNSSFGLFFKTLRVPDTSHAKRPRDS